MISWVMKMFHELYNLRRNIQRRQFSHSDSMGTSCAANIKKVSTESADFHCNEAKQNPEEKIQRQNTFWPRPHLTNTLIVTNLTTEFTIAEMAELIALV